MTDERIETIKELEKANDSLRSELDAAKDRESKLELELAMSADDSEALRLLTEYGGVIEDTTILACMGDDWECTLGTTRWCKSGDGSTPLEAVKAGSGENRCRVHFSQPGRIDILPRQFRVGNSLPGTKAKRHRGTFLPRDIAFLSLSLCASAAQEITR